MAAIDARARLNGSIGHGARNVTKFNEAAKAFNRIKADDEHATSPGDMLRELLNHYGPSLILIDEWVAYARQLHDQSDLPAGSFETHFTFAQAHNQYGTSSMGSDRCSMADRRITRRCGFMDM